MLRLIVNADDLGYSPSVNDAIFGWMARKRLSSSSLMANAPGLGDALRRVPDFPAVSFGVHLNVEEFAPLRPHIDLEPLLDEGGNFGRRLRTARRSPRLLRAVHREWSAQVEALLARGVRLSHLDSHLHAHNLPEMLPLLAALRRRYGIRCARITMNLFDPSERKSTRIRILKSLYNTALRRVCGFRTTDSFAFLRTAFRLEPGRLEKYGTIELMAHPGHPAYEDETRLLVELQERLPPHRLVTFNELA